MINGLDVGHEHHVPVDDAYALVLQDGIVLRRLPLARLGAGTTDVAAVHLSSTDGDLEWGLRIELTLTSEPGTP